MSQFTEALVISPLADGKTWVLINPFGYEIGKEGSGDLISVKPGFMTDFASIPRLFWAILPKWGKYGNAAVIHDWLYWSQKKSRKESDNIMLEAMTVLTVKKWKKKLIYYAVRLFGWIAWKRNRWDRNAGFERVKMKKKINSLEISRRPGFTRRAFRHLFLRNRIKK